MKNDDAAAADDDNIELTKTYIKMNPVRAFD